MPMSTAPENFRQDLLPGTLVDRSNEMGKNRRNRSSMAAKKGQRNIHQDEPIGMLPKDNHTSEKR
jgi:hypothetical protein